MFAISTFFFFAVSGLLADCNLFFLFFSFFRCFFWIFSYSSFICISEKYRLLLWWLIVNLGFFILINKDTTDCLINSLCCCFLKILFFTIAVKIKNILEHF